ncbi:ARM repeat superfamily protein [Rhynchospora pubera]|uniref:ARM repeat superfamily protein n=1 Tax=Rhynchospora pubera TaxID=906938 RepID=A0AAV8HGI8_9POAL|nr:ARM repeat superfamily protein [Rhynchospora pubera]
MTPQSPSPSETLDLILAHLLPLLLAAASTSVKALISRWRLVHSKLLLLQSSLSEASLARNSLSNPLFLDLVSSLHSTLQTLHSLSSRCLDPSLPTGRLLLQSDLDIATSSLTLHLQDLSLLLKSGLLSHKQDSPHAIVLPFPGPTSSKADIVLFIRDAFARLQIGNLDIKLKALDSLLELLQSDPAKLSPVVTAEGDVPVLLRLLDLSTHSHLIDSAAAVVSLLSTSSASSCHAVFNEGGLGPLLRLIESGSVTVRHRAAAAVEAITIDPARAWAVSAYGGITVLINACRSGSGSPSSLQSLVVSSLKNVASLEDVRIAIFEEGGIPVLVKLLASDNIDVQKSSTLCLWSLASAGGDEMCVAIIHESGLPRLLQLLYSSSDRELLENTLRAIHALSVIPSAAKSLSSSPLFFSRLAEFISRGGISNFSCQQIAASLVADLSPSDDIKKSMAPCMSPLVKMLEISKPVVMQETASRALVSLLDVKSNRKELVRDEKSMTRLVKMLDPCNDQVSKRPVVSVVLALTSIGGNGARKRLMETGANQFLQQLAESEVAGAKKALQRLSGSRLKNLFLLGRS